MRYVHLATEDALSEAVGLKLIATFLPCFEVDLKLGKKGNGLLKARIPSYCEIAKRAPFLLITDPGRCSLRASTYIFVVGDYCSARGLLISRGCARD